MIQKSNHRHVWLTTGYNLFAEEGHEGLQVERLARITGLNKSGFYHYFGDQDEFLNQLIKEHERLVDSFVAAISQVERYDPDYLNVLLDYKMTTFFQTQLVRNRHVKIFIEAHIRTNKKIAPIVTPLFSKEIGLSGEAAYPYYEMMREMFYTRIDFNSFTYEYLHAMVERFKSMISKIRESNN